MNHLVVNHGELKEVFCQSVLLSSYLVKGKVMIDVISRLLAGKAVADVQLK